MAGATRIESGSTTVVTAATAVQLIPAAKSPNFSGGALGVIVSPDSGNTEPIVIGGPNVKAKVKEQNGVVLSKTAGPIFIACTDPTALWVDAGTSGDKVSWLVLYQ